MKFVTYLDPVRLEEGLLTLPVLNPVCPLCGSEREGKERLYLRTYGHCESCEERLISKEEERMDPILENNQVCDLCGEPVLSRRPLGAMLVCAKCYLKMEKGWEGLKNDQ